MATLDCKLKSAVLQTTVNVNVYLPCDLPSEVGFEIKGVLTLLHGFSNSGEDWMQMTAAARYAADNGLALVAPSCTNSFYQDMVHGGAYKTFVTEEMPMLLARMFRLPREREKNFIAGLSMGGYGALYLAFTRPDLYAGCASFSGAVDLRYMLDNGAKDALSFVLAPIFGVELELPQTSDLHVLAKRIAMLPKCEQPRILMTNGFEDIEPYYVKVQNDNLHETMKELPFAAYKRMEWTGVHEWNFWDRSLVYAIDFFLQNGYAARKMQDWNAVPSVYE